jgi:predicted acylesterase/phospholipase RssA
MGNDTMKRILALDGGGIRGVFTLEVLLQIEKLLREHYEKRDPEKAKTFVLRDHFDFLAGTSTGAIIAACLCWGMTVKRVMDLYLEYGPKMFQPLPWHQFFKKHLIAKFAAAPISEMLESLFLEPDPETGKMMPATLASPLLRNGEKKNLLMVVLRNHTNGTAWPLTNNPDAIYNNPARADCNTQIPLWRLVRASTAAPTYFPPERIKLGDTEYVFVDGSITPYSNPAAIAALTAILPGYHINWPTGPEKIRLVSVGTLAFSSELPIGDPKLWVGHFARKIPAALLQSMGWQQDYLCRCLGECMFGELLDVEAGFLVDALDAASDGKYPVWQPRPGERWFSYVRYNRSFKKKEMQELLTKYPNLGRLEAVSTIPHLRRIGKEYAEANVKLEHLV